MKIASPNPKPSAEANSDRALYFLCDVGISLAFAVFAIVVTLLVWCPLELIQHTLHHRAQHSTQGSRV